MHTPCARFPARSSVLGVRPSALIRSRVPGARHPGLGSVSGLRSPAWTKGRGKVASPFISSGLHGQRPDTEDRAGVPENAPVRSASCILHPPSPDKGRVRGKGSTAPLPYCPIALLPYCPIALTPYCRALNVHIVHEGLAGPEPTGDDDEGRVGDHEVGRPHTGTPHVPRPDKDLQDLDGAV
jgi:hypothetical protein